MGEAPAADETRLFLEIVLALKAAGRTPPKGKVSLPRDVSWLARERPALLDFVERTTHVNLLQAYPGAGRKGSHFPTARGREAAEKLMSGDEMDGFGMVLLAGHRVSRSFGIRELVYFETMMVSGGVEFVVVPHPSGVNRWWNPVAGKESQNTRAARAYLERLGRRRA